MNNLAIEMDKGINDVVWYCAYNMVYYSPVSVTLINNLKTSIETKIQIACYRDIWLYLRYKALFKI